MSEGGDKPDYQGRQTDLREAGVAVFLTLRSPIQRGSDSPMEREVRALVDTGAHYSMVRQDIADELCLVEVDRITLSTFHGPAECSCYHVHLIVGADQNRRLWSDSLMVVAGRFPETGTEFLLGRDVLQHCELEIDWPIGRFSLNFSQGDGVE